MEDDSRRLARHLAGEPRQVAAQITLDETRLVCGGDRDCRAQSRQPIRLLGPDQRFEPCHLSWVREIYRIEIEAGPPRDMRQHLGERRGAGHGAGKSGCLLASTYGSEPPSAVIVPVKIGQEAEAGR